MKKNIISLTVYLFFFSSTPIFCQSFSDLIIDTVYNHYRDSIVEDFCHTLSNFNGEKYDFCLREKGAIEITVDGSVKDAEIKISLCNPQ